MIDLRFVDTMDPTRIVEPTEVPYGTNGTVTCRVFWKNDNGNTLYSGKVELPRGLFLTGEEKEWDSKSRTGFLPESLSSRLAPKSRKTKVRPSEEEEYEE